MKRARVTRVRMAGKDHAVNTIVGGRSLHRREPCSDCPWRKDATGVFPAEAFRLSADTAYDMAQSVFACHQSGSKAPALCAGFMLRAHHNLALRIRYSTGEIDPDTITDGGAELHTDYRAMAVANGVDPDDPCLAPCR